jgi:hypothetical protein
MGPVRLDPAAARRFPEHPAAPDGRFEQTVRTTFARVHSAAVARTIAGTIETFVCVP